MPELTTTLKKNLRPAITSGHPWIYSGALTQLPADSTGRPVKVFDKAGFVCWGVADPDHPIAVRVWSLDEDLPPNQDLVTARLLNALALRQTVIPNSVQACRLLHGAADGTPGWAVDRYQHVAVVRTDGPAAIARLDLLVNAIAATSTQSGIRSLVHRRARGDSGGPRAELIWGDEVSSPFMCHEYAWTMEVDPYKGQKTGWFVDQRENRRRVFDIASGLRVANLFAYTGGFSIAAALGGARHVATVDVSEPAIAAARRNFSANGLEPDDYEFAAADAFDWLEAAREGGREFDLVIIDPPSFAPNQRSIGPGSRAYRRLMRLGMSLLQPRGLLAAASCSSHITMAMFTDILAQAATAESRSLQLLARHGAGPDHPVLSAFPEGEYLKFVLSQIS